MARSIIYLLSLMLVFATGSKAQTLPPFQPEQDACNALQICNTFYTPYSYSGYGTVLELTQFGANAGCYTESNSVWFKLVVATAGNIVFSITPVDPTDDYDFEVHDITNDTCTNLTTANRIRCNGNNNFTGSNPGGIVGLNYTSTLTYVAAGTFGSSFLQYISAAPGDVYLIMVDNFSGSASGFTLDLTGTTATFVGTGAPVYDSLIFSNPCDNSTGFRVRMNKQILCSSISPNGSDFQIVPPLATVVTATGINCSGTNGYTEEIDFTFSNPLPPGNYILTPQTGADGNTLVDLCLTAQQHSDSIPFQVIAPLTVNAGPDQATCIGGSVQLNATITGGGVNNTFLWTPATALSNPGIPDPVATPTGNISYTVTVTPDGKPACAASDVVDLTILQGFDIVNNDTTICEGASVNLYLSGSPQYNFSWTPADYLLPTTGMSTTSTPDTTITYTVTASFPGCPDSIQRITITVEPVPDVYAGPDQTVCYDDTLRMQATVAPGWFQNYQYAWTPAGPFDQPMALNPLFHGLITTNATFTVTTPAGCTNSDGVQLTVVPADFISVSDDTAICPRDSAQLRVTDGISYIWRPALYISDSTAASPMVSPVTSTTYTVYAVDANGCLDTQSVDVTVFPGAHILLPDSVRIFPGEFYKMDPEGNGLYFSWFPPYGLSDDDIANPVAKPEVNTRYFVTAFTENGCAVSDSVDVYVSHDSYIDIPNAFTPGSGPNGTIRVVRKGEAVLKSFRIYNRWGNKVFETADINQGWDGTFGGKPQPMGVYIYEVEASTPSGKRFVKQGNITLIR